MGYIDVYDIRNHSSETMLRWRYLMRWLDSTPKSSRQAIHNIFNDPCKKLEPERKKLSRIWALRSRAIRQA
ncbi:uncharacterized protein N7506_001912 [Penicillium brevicompactum]|uniref:uncharacterized protein n=1 Tax=Penicillium brevicompactum TaxID=5074 RepID=UPI0025415074|nr:uncharacterized protein N7506_001912 [Penicillium brevicompactum]KAJ5348659.1 hypothetical protein N7506_001912 [Penicillium brevicompactum]